MKVGELLLILLWLLKVRYHLHHDISIRIWLYFNITLWYYYMYTFVWFITPSSFYGCQCWISVHSPGHLPRRNHVSTLSHEIFRKIQKHKNTKIQKYENTKIKYPVSTISQISLNIHKKEKWRKVSVTSSAQTANDLKMHSREKSNKWNQCITPCFYISHKEITKYPQKGTYCTISKTIEIGIKKCSMK